MASNYYTVTASAIGSTGYAAAFSEGQVVSEAELQGMDLKHLQQAGAIRLASAEEVEAHEAQDTAVQGVDEQPDYGSLAPAEQAAYRAAARERLATEPVARLEADATVPTVLAAPFTGAETPAATTAGGGREGRARELSRLSKSELLALAGGDGDDGMTRQELAEAVLSREFVAA